MRMQNMEKICKLCSNTFTTDNKYRLYCVSCNSTERGKTYRNLNLNSISCEYCAAMFKPRSRKHTVCSSVCRMRVNAKKQSQRGLGKHKGRVAKTFTCKVCNKEHTYTTSGVRKYCEACNLVLGNNKCKVSDVPCEWCGIQQFTYWRYPARFCSHSCSSKSLQDKGLGSKWDVDELKPILLNVIRNNDAALTVKELLALAGVSEQSYRKYGFNLASLYAELGRNDAVSFASKFEDRVYRSIISIGIEARDIVTQKSFNDLLGLSGRWPLRYDFFVSKHNLLVEADGRQHNSNIRQNSRYYNGRKVRKEHDTRKDKYAEDNNIQLVRVPYKPTFAEVLKFVKVNVAPLISNDQSKSL